MIKMNLASRILVQQILETKHMLICKFSKYINVNDQL